MTGPLAVLMLALGVGITTAVFSVVDAVLLTSPPWPHAERLVRIYGRYLDRMADPAWAASWNRQGLSWATWRKLEDEAATFDDVGAWQSARSMIFGDDRTSLAEVMRVSSNLPGLLGFPIVAGRSFRSDEDATPSGVALLSEEFWQAKFGGRADVVGSSISLAAGPRSRQERRTVVGIVAAGFQIGPDRPDVLLPVGDDPLIGSFRCLGRLAEGVSLPTAERLIEPVVRATEVRRSTSVQLVPLSADQLRVAARPLWILLGGAGLLLLIACANLAGLLLRHAQLRRGEIAVRMALGASTRHILRQLAAEYVTLAITATAVGIVLAMWLSRWLVSLAPPGLPRLDQVGLSTNVLLFAVLTGLVTIVVFGVAPSVLLARTMPATALLENGREGTGGRHKGQSLIVAGQLGLALLLIVHALLFRSTLFNLLETDVGFNPTGLSVVETTYTGSSGAAPLEDIAASLLATPGVANAAYSSTAPFFGEPVEVGITFSDNVTEVVRAVQQIVSPSYFQTLGAVIVNGRDFSVSDRTGQPVAIVSEEFARRLLATRGTGTSFTLQGGSQYEIVGVVRDLPRRSYRDEPLPTYYALSGRHYGIAHFLVRSSQEIAARDLRDAVTRVSAQVVVTGTHALEHTLNTLVDPERFRATLSAVFAAAAWLLAVGGVFSLAARSVAERQHEFGIRLAVGAEPRQLRNMVLRESLLLTGVGLAAGIVTIVLVSGLLRTLVVGVSPASPLIIGSSCLILCGTTCIATTVAARRAGRITALRAIRGS